MTIKKMCRTSLVGFYELSEEWQDEALSNYDEDALDYIYLEPLPDKSPDKHVLFCLNHFMKATRCEGRTRFFHGYEQASNTGGYGIILSKCGEECLLYSIC